MTVFCAGPISVHYFPLVFRIAACVLLKGLQESETPLRFLFWHVGEGFLVIGLDRGYADFGEGISFIAIYHYLLGTHTTCVKSMKIIFQSNNRIFSNLGRSTLRDFLVQVN
jgi:hypothetical protein